MLVEMIVRRLGDQTLGDFHDLLCKTCGLQVGERRESDNVSGGVYYRTSALGIDMRTEEWDGGDFADYDYCVRFKPARDFIDLDLVEGIADVVALEFALLDYDLVRVSTSFAESEPRRTVRRCLIGNGRLLSWSDV